MIDHPVNPVNPVKKSNSCANEKGRKIIPAFFAFGNPEELMLVLI